MADLEASRRRFARRQWARRWATWRGLVVLAVVGALIGVGGWVVLASSVLDVRGVEVSGTSYLRPAAVRRAAQVPLGGPLARADVGAVRERVEKLPAVASATVTRSWPHHVQVEIVERTPVAVVDLAGRLQGLDAEGVVFREFETRPRTLPLIRTSERTNAEALRESARVVGVLPGEVARRVAYVDVKTRDSISFTFRDGRVVVWGSADQSALKASVLTALMKAAHEAKSYDVSVPGNPTTR